jgi:SAM-dependent methyltransferase
LKISKEEIMDIDNTTIARYNRRFEKYGISAKTLGWGSKENQFTRFKTAVTHADLSGKSVLDIGCGFADFYDYLLNDDIKSYKGIDINPKLIEIAKSRFPENEYEVRNILLDNHSHDKADIVTLFGILNFKLKTGNNLAYTKSMITRAWGMTGETLIIDFLSSYLTKEYEKEDFVYYHNPLDILKFCFSLSDNILLIHDYPPIPQKEFMIILKRDSQ